MEIYKTHPFSVTDEFDNLHILRGRPGSGKTTYMRQVDKAAKEKGFWPIWYSGMGAMSDTALRRDVINRRTQTVFIDEAREDDLNTIRVKAKTFRNVEFYVALRN
jgi:adenylate kinase